MTLKHNIDFFNKMAGLWDSVTNHNPQKIKYLLDKLNIQPTDKILDVGTGTGILLPFILGKIGADGEITAIDVSENMIKNAMNKYPSPNIKFIIGDVTCADLPTNYFDKIICYSVFPHFVNPQDTLLSIKNFLKNEGQLLICHSESKEKINQRHEELGRSLISRKLPPVKDLICQLESRGYHANENEDTSDLYFVKATVKKI